MYRKLNQCSHAGWENVCDFDLGHSQPGIGWEFVKSEKVFLRKKNVLL